MGKLKSTGCFFFCLVILFSLLSQAEGETPGKFELRPYEAPLASPGAPARADTIWWGYFTIDGGEYYAVEGETWTFDHATPDTLEGWTPIDLTQKDFPEDLFQWVTPDDFECPAEAPMIFGSQGQWWLGMQQTYADAECWDCDAGHTCSLGYENMLRQELRSLRRNYQAGHIFVEADIVLDFEEDYEVFRGLIIATQNSNDIAVVDSVVVKQSAGTPSSPSSISLFAAESQMGSADGFRIVFDFTSDQTFSDEDGDFCSTYGAVCLDNISVENLGSGIDEFYDFETGQNGWFAHSMSGLGPYPDVRRVSDYDGMTNPPPPSSCGDLSGRVLHFHDADFGHPVGPGDQYFGKYQMSRALSPIIDRSAYPPGIDDDLILTTGLYASMPYNEPVYFRVQWYYYPYECPESGEIGWSPEPNKSWSFFISDPYCSQLQFSANDDYIPLDAELYRASIDLIACCECFPDCSVTTTNYTPLFDNIRIGLVTNPQQPKVINPEGSGDYTTIQAAIDDLESGSVIELTDGIFTGDGNRDIDPQGKEIVIRSQTRGAESCIIDCQGEAGQPHRAFLFQNSEAGFTRIEGITITGGYHDGGGAVKIDGASPTFVDCIFTNNYSTADGGAVFALNDASPDFENCRFIDNDAGDDGGALQCRDGANADLEGSLFAGNSANDDGGAIYLTVSGHVVMSYCTIADNYAPGSGSALSVRENSTALLDYCLIAFNGDGEAVECQINSTADLHCCDVYGNTGGDWYACIAGQETDPGNLSADPLFCDAAGGDYSLNVDSPCAEENNPDCGQIGAFGIGCDPSSSSEDQREPSVVRLRAIRPNPAASGTKILYDLATKSKVELSVLDVQGRLIRRLVDDVRTAGQHTNHWDGLSSAGKRVAPGAYYIRLLVNDTVAETRSVVMIK